MTAVAGKGGTFSWDGGSVATVNEWSLDLTNDMLDVTAFSTAAPQWRDFIAGLSGWTGAANFVYNPSSTGQDDFIDDAIAPNAVTVILEMDQTQGGKFSGSAYVSGLSFSAPIADTVSGTLSFQGTGAIAYTTTT